jgi:Ca2+-binding EF-hand superfamily protein
MCDQTKNIGQTFRVFDTQNKGKLRKADFVAGLERFSIALAGEDSTALWDALDTKKRGYLVFEDF